MTPSVSIIMPVYNKEAYLHDVFERICNQSYKDWEMIIIDDGSTDKGRKIIQEYEKKDERIFAYYQKNKGVSNARNNGLQRANGKWIWFIDADDLPSTEFLSEVFTNKLEPDVDVVAGGFSKRYQYNKIETVKLEEQGCFSNIEIPKLFMKYQYTTGFWGYLWNKLISKDLIIQNSVSFREGLALAEDLDFMVTVLKYCRKIDILPQNAMQYTVNSENSSAEKKVDYIEQLRIQKKIYDWIIIQNDLKQYELLMKRQISNYVAFCIFYGFEEGVLPKTIISRIPDFENTVSLMSENGIDHIMLPIVRCVKEKGYVRLYLYLFSRNILRNIYRCIIRKGC